MTFQQIRQSRFLPSRILWLSLLTIAVFFPLRAAMYPHTDLLLHSARVEQIRLYGDYVNTSYPLFHYGVMLLNPFPGGETVEDRIQASATAGLAVIILYDIATGIVLYLTLARFSGHPFTKRSSWVYVPLTIGLLLATPLILFDGRTEGLFHPYIHPNIVHNPTSLVARPFMIALFYLSLRAFGTDKSNLRWVIFTAYMSVFALLAKPSYTIVLLPGLALISLVYLLRRKPLQWNILIWGIVIPSIAVLGYQYTYNFMTRSNGMALGFFTVLQAFEITLPEILWKHFLSMIFPLGVTLAYWHRARGNLAIQLSWLIWLLGLVMSIFIYESGDRMLHSNFRWPLWNATFMLYVVTFIFWVRQYRGTWRDWRFSLNAASFAFHIINGFYWYWLVLQVTSEPDVIRLF